MPIREWLEASASTCRRIDQFLKVCLVTLMVVCTREVRAQEQLTDDVAVARADQLQLVTVGVDRAGGNDESFSPVITENGNAIAFHSLADNLCTRSHAPGAATYIYTPVNQQIAEIALPEDASIRHATSLRPAISSDGSKVCLRVGTMTGQSTAASIDYFIVIVSSVGEATQVYPRHFGLRGNVASLEPIGASNDAGAILFRMDSAPISGACYALLDTEEGKGRYLTGSDDEVLQAASMAGDGRCYMLLKREGRQCIAVTNANAGRQQPPQIVGQCEGLELFPPIITSRNGRYVMCHANSDAAHPEQTAFWMVDTRRKVGEVVAVPASVKRTPTGATLTAISDDGQVLAFVGRLTGSEIDAVYRYDRENGAMVLVSKAENGSLPDAACTAISASANGSTIVFASGARNIDQRVSSGHSNIYLWQAK